MLRLSLIIGALLTLQPHVAAARDKDEGKGSSAKLKLCVDGTGSRTPLRRRCLETSGVKPPPLQIGGTTFGTSGSRFKGGAPGTSLIPSFGNPHILNSRVPRGGGGTSLQVK